MDSTLPLVVRWLRAHGVTGLTPWHFVGDEDRQRALAEEYRREVAGKSADVLAKLLVIAARQDCDDVAGFIVERGRATEKVAVVHLTWSGSAEQEGFPSMVVYSSFESWITEDVWPASREWMSEEELAALEGVLTSKMS